MTEAKALVGHLATLNGLWKQHSHAALTFFSVGGLQYRVAHIDQTRMVKGEPTKELVVFELRRKDSETEPRYIGQIFDDQGNPLTPEITLESPDVA